MGGQAVRPAGLRCFAPASPRRLAEALGLDAARSADALAAEHPRLPVLVVSRYSFDATQVSIEERSSR